MKRKILIIEDNEQDRVVMKRFFHAAGFEDVLFSADGEEGVKKAEIEKPDLVITDTMLPGIDGFEVCQKLRSSDIYKGTKIIVMTGLIDSVDAVKARRLGADDYCVKTEDYSYLIEAAKKIFDIADSEG